MQPYFHIFEGDLFDTRKENWHLHPTRKNYFSQHSHISTLSDLKATLRAGPYTWPGRYPMFFYMSDNEAMCFKCAREEFKNIGYSINHKMNDGWEIVGCEINYEDVDLTCCNCYDPIESAYGEDENDSVGN